VVLFRLTQDEYNYLQAACSAGSARSLSDFARSRVLGPAAAEEMTLTQVEEKLSALKLAVDHLTHRLGKS
jgi:hypothetical protein